jgi:LacI family transcriptional regulator
MPTRVTIADVAARAGVHKGTVSRALNKLTEHQVNPATVKRVPRAARELGYVPNIFARGLRTSLSMTIGVILPDLTNPLFPPMVRGIESYISSRGYTTLIVSTDGHDDLEAAAFESLLERRVDGFVIATGQIDHPLLADAFGGDIPAVMLNRGSGVPRFPLVTGNDSAGIAEAVDHLVELGHRDIVHLSGPANLTTSVVRADALVTAASRHPHVHHTISTAPALSIQAGIAGMDELLHQQRELPTAVIAGNDLLAVGVLRSLRAHDLECPRDVSVIGFNDMPFAEDLNPPLTTVHIPHQELGAVAGRLLLEGIASREQQAVTVMLPASLVVRRSTAAPRSHSVRGGPASSDIG